MDTPDHFDNCIREDKDGKKQLKLHLDMKNFTPEEIKVKKEKNKLEVHAHHEEKEPNRVSCRVFHQQYVLPQDVRITKLDSKIAADGTLTVESPIKPRHRVKINSKIQQREIPNREQLAAIQPADNDPYRGIRMSTYDEPYQDQSYMQDDQYQGHAHMQEEPHQGHAHMVNDSQGHTHIYDDPYEARAHTYPPSDPYQRQKLQDHRQHQPKARDQGHAHKVHVQVQGQQTQGYSQPVMRNQPQHMSHQASVHVLDQHNTYPPSQHQSHHQQGQLHPQKYRTPHQSQSQNSHLQQYHQH